MELQIFAEQAMSAFKAEKVKNQPDPGALQSQIAQAQAEALQSLALLTAI